MLLDATLSFLHFTALLILSGALSAEAFVLRLPVRAQVVRLLVRIDVFYWLSVVLLLAAGVARVFLGYKGHAFYLSSLTFWAKLALYVLIVAISIQPTRRYLAWTRALRSDEDSSPPADEVLSVRKLVMAELHVLVLVVLAAVLMTRALG